MKLTLDWLIHKSGLNNLRCVCHQTALDNTIESVNILDNPDVIKWIKKDELVLSTGYYFKDDVPLQKKLIHELKTSGCPALCIKIKRFLDVIPKEMIEEAEKVGLPLIEIPFYYSFSDISKCIYNELYARELDTKQIQNSLIQKLSTDFFNNLGLDTLLKNLSISIQKPVILTDLNYSCLSLYMTEFYNYVLSESAYPSIELLQSNATEVKQLLINNYTFNFYMIALPNYMGYLFVLLENSPLDILHQEFLEKSIHIIALEVERSKALKRNVQFYHDFFFDFLMSDNRKTDEEIKTLCHLYGFDYKSKRLCTTYSICHYQDDYDKNEMLKNVHQALTDCLSHTTNTFICSNHDMICTFHFYPNEVDANTALHEVHALAKQVLSKISPSSGCELIIGLSRCHEGVSTITTAFKDSIKTIQMQELIKDTSLIASYFYQLPYHLLSELIHQDLEKIYDDTVKKLVLFDKENHMDLIPTLKMYYECKFNATEASKKLFLHRNTLLYRLDKIKDLLHTDLTQFHELFSLYLGICAYELLGKPY